MTTTDPLGYYTTTGYDGLGRRRCLQEGGVEVSGAVQYATETRFDYEPTGRLQAMVSGGADGLVDPPNDADNQTTSYAYDTHGRLATTTYPDGHSVYDTWHVHNGALQCVVDQNSIETTYTYQAALVDGAYVVETRPHVTGGTPTGDQEVVLRTDGLGRTTEVVTDATPGGTQTSRVTNCYEYCGALGRQDQQLGDSGGIEWRVKYDYNTCGTLARLNWPYQPGTWVGDHVAYSNFDGLNRPRTIRNCTGGCYADMVHYTFLGGRVATKEYPQPDPTKTVRQTFWSPAENNYDAFGRLLRSHAVSDPDGAANPLMDIGYQYDNDGNPTWRYDALQNAGSTQWSQKYQYDQLNRLSCAMQGAINNWQGQGGQQSISPQKNWVWNDTFGGQTYSLDAMGNFVNFYNNGTVDQRTHNTSNEIITRLLGGTAKNPSYDAAGNMTDDGEQYKFVYDFRNRLISVTTRDATPKKVLDFAYDGLDRRIRKTSYAGDGSTVVCDVRFLYDGQRIIEKRDHGNSDFLLARYVYGTQYIDEPIRMYRDSNLDGSFADPNDNFYFLQDRLYNVVALTDTDGQVQERVVYEPYGKSTCHRVSDGDETVASHFGNPYLFTGRELDSETGLYNYNHRYYSTALGRFINRDPILYRGGDANLYRYVGNKPTNRRDPFGLDSQPIRIVVNGPESDPDATWEGDFVWSCVPGHEDGYINESPGFTGWGGHWAGGQVGWVGFGLWDEMVPGKKSAWEDCSTCENGKLVQKSQLHIYLTVTIKLCIALGFTYCKEVAQEVFDKTCPCRENTK